MPWVSVSRVRAAAARQVLPSPGHRPIRLILVAGAAMALLFRVALATPPSIPPRLYVRQVLFRADGFQFLTANLETAGSVGTDRLGVGLFPFFQFSGNPEHLRAVVNDEEILRVAIRDVEEKVRRFNHTSQEWHTLTLHRFPGRELRLATARSDAGMAGLDHSRMKVFLDDQLVWEVVLGYAPAQIYSGPGMGLARARVALAIGIVAFALVAAIVAALLVRKRLKRGEVG